MSAIGERNLANLAEASRERRGDYPALLYEGRWHSSGELFDRATRLASGLRAVGVQPGDRVIVTMANCPEVGIAYNALWRAGAVVTPVTFLLPADELRHIAVNSRARAVLTTADLLERSQRALDGLEQPPMLVVAGGEVPPGALALEELEAHEPAAITPRDDGDLAALLYTGGTTGRAKGVMLSHAALCYTAAAAQSAAHVEGITRSLMTLPVSHAYGLLVTLTGLYSPEPGVAVLMRWFDPDRFLGLIAEHRLQQSALVPTMFQMLLSAPLESHDLTSLEYLSSGGAALAPEIADEFRRRVPSVTIRQGYGLTETAALVSTTPTGQGRPGSVGLPITGTEVRIRGEHGAAVPQGEVGEICVRSPGMMQGYWEAPDATAEAIRDGWLHTGDLGYLDEDGYLYIVDRKKDLIIRSGFNVYPRDVEDRLLEHPEIETAGVVGRPDRHRGEEVVAFVKLRAAGPRDPQELVGWARESIGGYRYPREIHIVDQVPLTPAGKVDRKALRALLAAAEDDSPTESSK